MNDPFIISRTNITSLFNTYDHNTVNTDIMYCIELAANIEAEPILWKAGNYDKMCTHLSHYNWCNLFAYKLTADSL